MNFVIVFLCFLPGQWQGPNPIEIVPLKIENYQFKSDKSQGFKLYYMLSKADFKGKMPEHIMIWTQKEFNLVEVESSVVRLAENEENAKWYIRNIFNKEIDLVLYFYKDPKEVKDWKKITLKSTWLYITENQRRNEFFHHEVGQIKGVVGCGNGTGDPKDAYSVGIASCMPNIAEIKKAVELIAQKYNVRVGEYELRDGYDYLLKDEK